MCSVPTFFTQRPNTQKILLVVFLISSFIVLQFNLFWQVYRKPLTGGRILQSFDKFNYDHYASSGEPHLNIQTPLGILQNGWSFAANYNLFLHISCCLSRRPHHPVGITCRCFVSGFIVWILLFASHVHHFHVIDTISLYQFRYHHDSTDYVWLSWTLQ